MRQSRVVRVLRGSIAAALATFVALHAHVAGGGAMPGWVGIVVPLVISLAVSTLLVGRRVSLWRLTAAVGASQFAFHALFVLGTFSPSAGGASAPHHHEHGMLMTDDLASAPVSLALSGTTMWFWHVLAALLTTAALYRGERALLRLRELAVDLVSWVRRALVAWTGAVLAPAVRETFARVDVDARVLTSVVTSSVSRRGPPLAHAV